MTQQNPPPATVPRKRKNFRIPADLADWAEKYAADKNTSMTQLIVDYLTHLRDQEQQQP